MKPLSQKAQQKVTAGGGIVAATAASSTLFTGVSLTAATLFTGGLVLVGVGAVIAIKALK